MTDFRDDLRPMLAVTEEELASAVASLPAEIRERLAHGPIPRRYTCGVCVAFGASVYKSLEPDLDDPMWVAFSYHEVPKIDMKVADDQWYGGAANEVYRRCIATYRAAGWTGEAEEPNA